MGSIIDFTKRVINVVKAKGGKAPNFNGSGSHVGDGVRQEMRRMYMSNEVSSYLNKTVADLLVEGRENFVSFDLSNKSLVPYENSVVFFPWTGDTEINTFHR